MMNKSDQKQQIETSSRKRSSATSEHISEKREKANESSSGASGSGGSGGDDGRKPDKQPPADKAGSVEDDKDEDESLVSDEDSSPAETIASETDASPSTISTTSTEDDVNVFIGVIVDKQNGGSTSSST